jgi:hypothetical protein
VVGIVVGIVVGEWSRGWVWWWIGWVWTWKLGLDVPNLQLQLRSNRWECESHLLEKRRQWQQQWQWIAVVPVWICGG